MFKVKIKLNDKNYSTELVDADRYNIDNGLIKFYKNNLGQHAINIDHLIAVEKVAEDKYIKYTSILISCQEGGAKKDEVFVMPYGFVLVLSPTSREKVFKSEPVMFRLEDGVLASVTYPEVQ